MDNLPMALYGARELAEMDRRAFEHGLSAQLLMERAGGCAFLAIRERWPEAQRWFVYAGGGNNGGDGYIVARRARLAGFDVAVVEIETPREGSVAAEAALAYRNAGGIVAALDEADSAQADLIVDALFGIGLNRAPEGVMAQTIQSINAAAAPVVALDLPSGLLADTGAAPGVVVRAALTVTFIGLKAGLYTGIGPGMAGEIVFENLKMPEALKEGLVPKAYRIEPNSFTAVLAPRQRSSHKGMFGHVLVAGGDHGTGGAACLSGEAALRVGAGLVSVLTHPEHVTALLAARPELMAHQTKNGALPAALAERATVVALGPGLGQSAWSKKLWTAALALDKPVVLDADGLNLLAAEPRARGNWILTPHPGEAGRLLGISAAEVERDRFAALAQLVERYNAVVVLKGAGTLIGGPGDVSPYLCDHGNPGMASGGMGDALTGVIAGLLAQGVELPMAARLGACLHASAADRAAAAGGERGLLASDLIAELRALVNP